MLAYGHNTHPSAGKPRRPIVLRRSIWPQFTRWKMQVFPPMAAFLSITLAAVDIDFFLGNPIPP
ncbi:hypothetical protein BD410DRAFT_796589 [Rickenella mellea]|uniref:Uncharacterized protein n=1 Tax=Rickenella mellea TaxID=50990 RepID=A0A4Y7PL75_9AGAM|nr:hypothetical protein BD410DRAFT_796589 [Rickenella mellea]